MWGVDFWGIEKTPQLCWRVSPVELGTAVLSGLGSKLVSVYSRKGLLGRSGAPAAERLSLT